MKNVGLGLGLLFLMMSTQAMAEQACSIDPGFVTCIDMPAEYDQGCSVVCKKPETASCDNASVTQTMDQYGRYTSCQLFPSQCYCQ